MRWMDLLEAFRLIGRIDSDGNRITINDLTPQEKNVVLLLTSGRAVDMVIYPAHHTIEIRAARNVPTENYCTTTTLMNPKP